MTNLQNKIEFPLFYMQFFDPLILFLITDEIKLQIEKTVVNYLRGCKDRSRFCCRKMHNSLLFARGMANERSIALE